MVSKKDLKKVIGRRDSAIKLELRLEMLNFPFELNRLIVCYHGCSHDDTIRKGKFGRCVMKDCYLCYIDCGFYHQ